MSCIYKKWIGRANILHHRRCGRRCPRGGDLVSKLGWMVLQKQLAMHAQDHSKTMARPWQQPWQVVSKTWIEKRSSNSESYNCSTKMLTGSRATPDT